MRHTLRIACLTAAIALFPLAMHAQAAKPKGKAPAASTLCTDGTTSMSTGAGTCSGHGGIRKATTCKDGTLSQSSGAGTCSGHGGIKAAAPAKAAAKAAKASTPRPKPKA